MTGNKDPETEGDVADSGFSPEQIDTTKPHPARMYDYYLGGQDNYEVDREAAERVLGPRAVHPARPPGATAAFITGPCVPSSTRGIRQIIDIGTGIPTSPNTHEVARDVAPETRVVYVDNDPIVATTRGPS